MRVEAMHIAENTKLINAKVKNQEEVIDMCVE